MVELVAGVQEVVEYLVRVDLDELGIDETQYDEMLVNTHGFRIHIFCTIRMQYLIKAWILI